jgi:bifunctional DNA-binding transcriptional regulator/antitoxin component of YhaV-PrlF toxin-antitoxin module
MSITSKLTAKNQTTIPKAVVEALQIKPSSLLMYEIEPDGRVVLTAKSATFEDLADTFPAKRPRKPVSDEQLNEAVRSGATKRFRKSK